MAQPSYLVFSFYSLCETELYPVYRQGSTAPTLEQSVSALVLGTTPEEHAFGLSTGFDLIDEADQIEVDAVIDADGIAHIDFLLAGERWNPGSRAGTSAQLFSFLDPLEATVFRYQEVFGLDRSTLCWGESDCRGIMTRAEWEGMVFVNMGVLSHGGCDPELAWRYRDRCTLKGVLAGPILTATVANVAADDVLNVRVGPGAEYFEVGMLAFGASVEVTNEAAVADDGGIWRLLNTEEWGPGWVNAAFLEIPRTKEEALVDAFMDFARKPGDDSFAALPLSDLVELGLGPQIITAASALKLRQPSEWVLDVDEFRAYAGPFSALEPLQTLGVYDVTIGQHPHCASEAMPPPDGLETMTRISVQPRLGFQSSCLMWFSVDFFVTPDGFVKAITLDIWEP